MLYGILYVKGKNTASGNPNRGWALTRNGVVIDWIEEGYEGSQALTSAYPLVGRFLDAGATLVHESPARFRREAAQLGPNRAVTEARRLTLDLELSKLFCG